MRAHHEGPCARCPERIAKDEQVVQRGEGWIHAVCASGADDVDQQHGSAMTEQLAATAAKPAKKAAAAKKPTVADIVIPAIEPAPPLDRVMVVPEIPAEGIVIPNLDEPTYHAHPTSVSVSGLKKIRVAPALYQHEREHPTTRDTFDYGSAAHLYVLGAGPEIVELRRFNTDGTSEIATDRRSPTVAKHAAAIRAAGKLPLMADAHAKVKAMAAQLREHRLASKLLGGGDVEVSGFMADPETGVMRRGRADLLRSRVIVDYKSAANANPARLGKVAHDNGWYMQAPFYTDLFRDLGHDIARFLFIVQEKDAPFLVSVVSIVEPDTQLGRTHNREAMQRFRDCTETGLWPGYQADGDIAPIRIPGYAHTVEETR